MTGAHHAAAWATPDGELVTVMGDVGRHNALDKLLGQRAQQRLPNADGFIIMSSRACYELVRVRPARRAAAGHHLRAYEPRGRHCAAGGDAVVWVLRGEQVVRYVA